MLDTIRATVTTIAVAVVLSIPFYALAVAVVYVVTR